MNFARELENKLTGSEWNLVAYYVNKAQDYYDAENYSEARSSLEDAVAVALSNGEDNAANKIQYYTRFCWDWKGTTLIVVPFLFEKRGDYIGWYIYISVLFYWL